MQRNSSVVKLPRYTLFAPLQTPPPPPFSHTLNFQIRIVFNFSRYHCDTQEKLRSKARHFFFGGAGGASKVFYGRCANGEFNGESTPQTKLNLWLSPLSSQRRNPCSGTYAHRWFVKKSYRQFVKQVEEKRFSGKLLSPLRCGPGKKDICYKTRLGLRLRRRLA